MVKIAPSILSADFSRLGEEIAAAEKAGADLVHIDVMDGHFVPNITIGPLVVKSVKKIASIPLDVHLMIEEPDKYIKDFADSGADIITVHSEVCLHLHRTVQNIKECGVKAAVSVNPATPLGDIEFILPFVDMVLIMSVNPGFGGQKFIAEVLPKIEQLKNMISLNNYRVDIEVDGGVTVDNVAEVDRAGADIVVMGSAFYNSENYAETIKAVRERCG
ncbi:MAG TPA: ribulose-phosphate 3-epimerase [Nitrospirae bacterium]|nr:ribulose-phosphate 3-epimerase [bacterium BMS3Abin06]HDH12030.1 ribulose-phosphate 3-epimerase [Nitrospirota bacterium]HDZ00850.1 ribulose-phosphate 3-epimerase [Nitrospirota bacterium]